jgi:hypothetical protein
MRCVANRVVGECLRVGAVRELGSELGELLVAVDGEVLLVVLGVVEELLGLCIMLSGSPHTPTVATHTFLTLPRT